MDQSAIIARSSELFAAPGRGVGMLVAASVVPGTFARSLSQRSWLDQGVITGLSTGTTYLLASLAHDVLEVAGNVVAPSLKLPVSTSELDRQLLGLLAVDLVAVPLALGTVSLLPRHDGESVARGLLRQSAWRLGVTGFGGAALSLSTAGLRQVDRRLGDSGRLASIPLAVPLGLVMAVGVESLRQRGAVHDVGEDFTTANPVLGLASAGAVVVALSGAVAAESFVAARFAAAAAGRLPGSEAVWRLVGHTLSIGAVGAGTLVFWGQAMQRIEAGTTDFDDLLDADAADRWTDTTISGSPTSVVPWSTLGREGRRHAVAYARPTPMLDRPEGMGDRDLSIQAVMGEPALATPIQVYVGLDSAATATARVDLALAEMDRTGAWQRSLLMLVSPTGTGYVNYCAVAGVQYLTRGDVATVTLQYSKRPSPLSLGKISQAREQNRLLWLKILERVRQMPLAHRPKVVVFGESLGAHTSQDVFMHWGTLGPEALGIDRALWIGTPYGSKWMQQVTGAPRPDVDPSVVAMVNDLHQIEEMDPDRRSKLRYVLLSHDNDGVTKFGPDLLALRPRWLGPDRPVVHTVEPWSPRGIPASMRWRPVTTFFQSLVDMKNAQLPGVFRAWAHDYRPALAPFLREVSDLPATDAQLARISDAIEQRESVRETLFD